MAWTQTDLDTIEKAIASGELIVQFGDRRVQYRSIAELKESRAEIKTAVDSVAGTLPVRQIYVNVLSGKGF